MGISEDRARIRSRLASIAAGDRGDTLQEPDWLAAPDQEVTAEAEGWLPDRWQGARLNPGRAGVGALLVVGVVAAALAFFGVWRDRPVAQAVPALPAVAVQEPLIGAAPTPPPTAAPAPETGEIVVSVVGLVNTAGLVRLPAGSRVADALAAAGGVHDGADTLSLNLAQRLGDGDQILVAAAALDGVAGSAGSATVGPGANASSGQPDPAGDSVLVNLNTATEAQLDSLPGVGPVTASSILAWRKTSGPFTDVAQLGEIDGIGPVRLEKLRGLVTV